MRGSLFTIILLFALLAGGVETSSYAQHTLVEGRVVDAHSNLPISAVSVSIEGSGITTSTDAAGMFKISGETLQPGIQTISLDHPDYLFQRIQISIERGKSLMIDPIILKLDLASLQAQIGVVNLTEAELDGEQEGIYNISGLLEASRDVFTTAAAYDFSASFFRPRGLDGAFGKVLLNGVPMNKSDNGRPQWSNWGGLNAVQRDRQFAMGLSPSEFDFGGIAGTTNIAMRASSVREGGSISYALANRSYRGRVMGSYSSGPGAKGWWFAALVSLRYGDRGYVEGTPYEAYSVFAAVEKSFSRSHSLNLTLFYTPNRRGRGTALTEEMVRLKGTRYNPNWGWQDNQIRSSRVRRIEEPVLLLNHYLDLSEKTTLNTNLAYQFGRIGNSRLDYSGNRNPAANYYQRLPSYFLRNPDPSAYDFELAYNAEQYFIENGQLDWHSFYDANANTSSGYSTYIMQEDVTESTNIIANTILNSTLSGTFNVQGKLQFQLYNSDNYAEVQDLLGGEGYPDIDYFGSDPLQSQNNLDTPNRVVQRGDRYKYNYLLLSSKISGFVQAQYKRNKLDLFSAVTAEQTGFQREGLYRNGYFPQADRSLGTSKKASFFTYGVKVGGLYKVTAKHLVRLQTAYLTKAPNLNQVFANVRQNNDLVLGISPLKIQMADLSYIFRSLVLRSRITAYLIDLRNQTDIGFFFTQNALGNDENSAFVQEIVTGIDQRNSGIVLGLEAFIIPELKLKMAASVSQYLYTNAPDLYLSGDDFDDPITPEYREGNDLFKLGSRKVALKNLHVASGPEQVGQIGLEYRDPDYWWLGITLNYFSNAYIDISKLRRTSDFFTDRDGHVINDYDPAIASILLRQEQLEAYYLLNAVGGKSWRLKDYFLGFFVSVNNLLNTKYKTGGFEDSRRAGYRQQLEEYQRPQGPLFGNRYFFGTGTTYFFNIYLRF